MQFSYTRQSEALGLGHAVLCAAELVGDEPFAVLLGDVIMESAVPATRELVEIYEATGSGAIHVERVPRERVHLYGIVDAAPEKKSRMGRKVLAREAIWSKSRAPKRRRRISASPDATSCRRKSSTISRRRSPGTGGEIQLTDGLCRLAEDNKMLACIYDGKVHDAGDKLGFLQATVNFGLKDPKLGKDFREYLRGLKL